MESQVEGNITREIPTSKNLINTKEIPGACSIVLPDHKNWHHLAVSEITVTDGGCLDNDNSSAETYNQS